MNNFRYLASNRSIPARHHLAAQMVLGILFFFLSSCAQPVALPSETPRGGETFTPTPLPTILWPTESWAVSSPQDEGLNVQELERITRTLELGNYGKVDRFLLILNGKMVLDESFDHDYSQINLGEDTTSHPYNYYSSDWHPFYQDTNLHTLQSVSKSVTSLLVGIAIDRGDLPEKDIPIMDYFDVYEIQNLDESKARITLEDLLTMRSGLDWNEWEYPFDDSRNITIQMENSDDWIQFVLDLPMAHEPGEVWAYSSGASQLISVIMKEATGLYIDEYAEEHLFGPLGITDYFWKKTPQGWPDTEGGLYLRSEDLARIGYLMLQKGVWDGEQIVSKAWVADSTTVKVSDVFPEDPYWDWNYGYMWWKMVITNMELPDVVYASGYGGQYLFIVPDLNLITVFNGWNIYGYSALLIDLFIYRLLPLVL